MKKIFLIYMLCNSSIAYAQQNLVLNPSFEQILHCPVNNNQLALATYWNGIDSTIHPDSIGLYPDSETDHLPDLMHYCGNFGTRCPNNRKFFQYPRTGQSMVQAIMYFNFYYHYSFTGNDTFYAQNYVQGRLSTALTAGTNYCVTFYVNMEDYFSAIAVGHIGAYLDDGTIDTTTNPNRPLHMFTPPVVDTNIISDTMNWVKIQGSFTAVGNEKFITLGVFRDTVLLRKLVIDPLGLYSAYLIDDVSVIESNATAYAGRVQRYLPAIP